MIHKIPNIASFSPKLGSTVSQINKVPLPYIVCVLFCDLMGFESVNSSLSPAAVPQQHIRQNRGGPKLCPIVGLAATVFVILVTNL